MPALSIDVTNAVAQAKARNALQKALEDNRSPTTINTLIKQLQQTSAPATKLSSLSVLSGILKRKFDPTKYEINTRDPLRSLESVADALQCLAPEITDNEIAKALVECLPNELRAKYDKGSMPISHYIDRPARPASLDDMIHWVMAHCYNPAIEHYFQNAKVHGSWPSDKQGNIVPTPDVLEDLIHWHRAMLKYWTPLYNKTAPREAVLNHAAIISRAPQHQQWHLRPLRERRRAPRGRDSSQRVSLSRMAPPSARRVLVPRVWRRQGALEALRAIPDSQIGQVAVFEAKGFNRQEADELEDADKFLYAQALSLPRTIRA
ncbi:hypothetical protein HDU93_002150 [Gonapodya sp. JEL0774]|nr:hypothetical protein HDU93_002150 [Gonapodya sp. JEL0774]